MGSAVIGTNETDDLAMTSGKEEARTFNPFWAGAVLVLLVLVVSLPMLWKHLGGDGQQALKPLKEYRFQVDINQASSRELQALPSLGPKLAGRIENYRNENGPFSSLDELRRVPGIGEKSLQELLPYLIMSPD